MTYRKLLSQLKRLSRRQLAREVLVDVNDYTVVAIKARSAWQFGKGSKPKKCFLILLPQGVSAKWKETKSPTEK